MKKKRRDVFENATIFIGCILLLLLNKVPFMGTLLPWKVVWIGPEQRTWWPAAWKWFEYLDTYFRLQWIAIDVVFASCPTNFNVISDFCCRRVDCCDDEAKLAEAEGRGLNMSWAIANCESKGRAARLLYLNEILIIISDQSIYSSVRCVHVKQMLLTRFHVVLFPFCVFNCMEFNGRAHTMMVIISLCVCPSFSIPLVNEYECVCACACRWLQSLANINYGPAFFFLLKLLTGSPLFCGVHCPRCFSSAFVWPKSIHSEHNISREHHYWSSKQSTCSTSWTLRCVDASLYKIKYCWLRKCIWDDIRAMSATNRLCFSNICDEPGLYSKRTIKISSISNGCMIYQSNNGSCAKSGAVSVVI